MINVCIEPCKIIECQNGRRRTGLAGDDFIRLWRFFILMDTERLKGIDGPLLGWFDGHARSLPWRDNPLPYYVWVSEIMLLFD